MSTGMLTIIDYGTGNLRSIKNMFNKIGYKNVVISKDYKEIEKSDLLVLPGVGHYDHCIKQFENSGLRSIIEEKVLLKKVPLLGICVGHQLLFENSEEGTLPGLGWIPGRVVKFKKDKLPDHYKIPHMSWAELIVQQQETVLDNIESPRFYFVHSYYVECEKKYIAATANYGYDFAAAIKHNNIHGVQFHPEKSHKYGMQLLRNFINIESNER